jgi:hypothetical protein
MLFSSWSVALEILRFGYIISAAKDGDPSFVLEFFLVFSNPLFDV